MKKKTQKNISDEDLAETIKDRLRSDPVYYTDFLKDIIDSRQIKPVDPKVLIKLPLDMLFYPEVRRTLILLTRAYRLEKHQIAKEYLKQFGESLIAVGQGRPKSISIDTELNLRYDFPLVDETCKEIYKRSKVSLANRNLSIKEKFPKESETIIQNGIPDSPDKLRDLVLCTRYKISSRSLKEFQIKETKRRKELSEEFPDVFPPTSK